MTSGNKDVSEKPLPHAMPTIARLEKEVFSGVNNLELKAFKIFNLSFSGKKEIDINFLKIEAYKNEVLTLQKKLTGSKVIVSKNALEEFDEEDIKKEVEQNPDAEKDGDFGKELYILFLIHLGYKYEQILALLGEDEKEELRRIITKPDYNIGIFKDQLAETLERVKYKLYIDNFQAVRDSILNGIRAGLTPDQIAQQVHSLLGGNLWEWQRAIRSNVTLMQNKAFLLAARSSGCKYERWRAYGGACERCAALSGQVWLLNTGPWPVEDTHPNCACDKEAFYEAPGEVNPKWSEPSPYKEP